ncbi:MAG: hypothetical protein NC332_04405 [Firmicutes bacterium]|nr:hypothetical protein [Bacillota bacterium]
MNKRMDFIDLLKINNEIPECRNLLDKLLEYYNLKDIETGGVYGKVFHALYYENYGTYDEIMYEYCITPVTFHRYRIQYNNLALELSSEQLKSDFNLSKNGR